MRQWLYILFALTIVVPMVAAEKKDTIYTGTTIKFDLGSAAFHPIKNIRDNSKTYSYEVAASVGLLRKYFPTIEAGYAQSKIGSTMGDFVDYGGFVKIGADYSALRKRKGDHHFFVGLRIATAMQSYRFNYLKRANNYWLNEDSRIAYPWRFGSDFWGELNAGVQVQVWKNLNMGWYVRFKLLFTRGKQLDGIMRAAYIPGYGTRQETAFGWNYYIGWTF